MIHRIIDAKIQLLTTTEGGRVGPLLSGYRSLVRFEGSTVAFGFELDLATDDKGKGLAPGESGSARLTFWAAEELPKLYSGMKFEILEGIRVVGRGKVTGF